MKTRYPVSPEQDRQKRYVVYCQLTVVFPNWTSRIEPRLPLHVFNKLSDCHFPVSQNSPFAVGSGTQPALFCHQYSSVGWSWSCRLSLLEAEPMREPCSIGVMLSQPVSSARPARNCGLMATSSCTHFRDMPSGPLKPYYFRNSARSEKSSKPLPLANQVSHVLCGMIQNFESKCTLGCTNAKTL